MGAPSEYYPYSFSIYKWLYGTSINLLILNDAVLENLALDLAKFLKELESIHSVNGPAPGQHNWWRGDSLSVYDEGACEQIAKLIGVIDVDKAIKLWERACKTKWDKLPVWIHGDFATGNMLLKICSINLQDFRCILETYKDLGCHIETDLLEAALFASLGNLLNWLAFNIKRSIDFSIGEDEHHLAIAQVGGAIKSIAYFHKNLIPIEKAARF